MGKTVLVALCGGGLSAVAALAAQLGLPGSFVLACFAPLPLLAVGLARGLHAGAIAPAAGVTLAMAVAGPAAAGVFAGLHALPSWLIVYAAIVGIGTTPAAGAPAPVGRIGPVAAPANGAATAGTVLGVLAVYAAALACAVAVATRGPEGIEAGTRIILDQAVAVSMSSLPLEARESFVQTAAPLFIGLFGISWQILIAGNTLLAQRIVSRRGWAMRPTPAWSALRLPDWLAWPLVGVAALALVTSGDVQFLARSAALILATPYFFLGLAVVHAFARRSRGGGLMLAALYILLVIFTIMAGAVVAGLGMIEQWAGVRKRLGPPAQKE